MVRTWLITGSSRGFGWELAKAVLEHGDNLVATARRPEQLEELVRRYSDRVRAVALDVTDADAARLRLGTCHGESRGALRRMPRECRRGRRVRDRRRVALA
ncbi:MAG: SDR family NAD(P)-dependent oxidoreductase [Pseudonocardiaceae bacterium]